MERIAREMEVGQFVKFLGWVSPADLPDLYRMADTFVMPSTGEGFGIAFLEAMACGIPAVGGDRDGSVDALQEGMLGQSIALESIRPCLEMTLAKAADAPDYLWMRVQNTFGQKRFAAAVSRLASTLSPD